MPCLVVIALLGFPRLALVLIWLLTDYMKTAFATVLWPVLGFFFAPYTTLCYMWAANATHHHIDGVWVFVVVVGVLFDLGAHGATKRKKRRRVVVVRKD